MGVFDVFTGDAQKDAASQTRQFVQDTANEGKRNIDTALAQSLDYTAGGYGNARGNLTNSYGTATGAVGTGIDAALKNLDQSSGTAQGYLDQSKTDALGSLTPLTDLASKYGAGTSLYLDALGVNGADAAAKARDAFTPSLSYDFTLDQGLDAINRRRNAAGMLDSGNADRDAQTFVTGVASQESNNWLDRLAGLINPELTATSTAATTGANINQAYGTNSANLAATTGQNKAQLEASRGSMLADLATKYGTSMAGLDTGEAAAKSGYTMKAADQKLGNLQSTIAPTAAAFKNEADAETAASGNLVNFGLNLAKLAAGGIGGIPGAGSVGSIGGANTIGGTGLPGFGGLY